MVTAEKTDNNKLTQEEIDAQVNDIIDFVYKSIKNNESLECNYIGRIPDEVKAVLEKDGLTITSSYVEYDAVSVYSYSDWRWENHIKADNNPVYDKFLKAAIYSNKSNVMIITTKIEELKKISNATEYYVDNKLINKSVWTRLEKEGYDVRSWRKDGKECIKVSWQN